MKQGMRTALADGWGGSMVATELSDVLFGSPLPLRSRANLGVIEADNVNIIVHGHEPLLSDVLAIVAKDEALNAKARAKGAKGIGLAGICCTANEILVRHGVPLAGNFMQQELALLTGAIEMMVVDVQCLMPSVATVAHCFHTKLVTTSSKAKMPGVRHIEFHEAEAKKIATEIIEEAIENYGNRKSERVYIPKETENSWRGSPPSPCSPSRRQVSRDLPSAQRCHHHGPSPGSGGRDWLFKSAGGLRVGPYQDGEGASQERRARGFNRLQRDHLREAWPLTA